MSRPPRRVTRIRHAAAPPAPQSAVGNPALPAWKAFLLQFSIDSGAGGAVLSGRIEHLTSGRRVRFGSREELLAALTRLLETIEKSEPGE